MTGGADDGEAYGGQRHAPGEAQRLGPAAGPVQQPPRSGDASGGRDGAYGGGAGPAAASGAVASGAVAGGVRAVAGGACAAAGGAARAEVGPAAGRPRGSGDGPAHRSGAARGAGSAAVGPEHGGGRGRPPAHGPGGHDPGERGARQESRDRRSVTVSEQGLPEWLLPVARAARTVEPHQLSRFLPPKNGSGRQSAVLILFGEGPAGRAGDVAALDAAPAAHAGRSGTRAESARAAGARSHDVGAGFGAAGAEGRGAGSARGPEAGDGGAGARADGVSAVDAPVRSPGPLAAGGPELLLMERAGTLRSHAGQPSFPGGALDPEDGDPAGDGPLRAALREAEEETGLDPRGVQLFGVLPRLYIPVSEFVVTPVLGWWRRPSPVAPVDPAETARVFTVPVAELTDPANRAVAVHPSGHRGPAFLVGGALVWGFTAGVIDRILHFAGWERPWDRERHVPLDWRA